MRNSQAAGHRQLSSRKVQIAIRLDPEDFEAIRNRAHIKRVSFASIAQKLVQVALIVGDLDTHFPIEEDATP